MEAITTGTVTVQSISRGTVSPSSHPNDVKFKVKYPEGYQGKKHMPESIVIISKESAEQFSKAGIGHIATDEELKAAASVEGDGENKKSAGNNNSKPKAADLIAKIADAASPEEVDALLPEGEDRKTVLDAAATRKDQLGEAQG